MHFKHGNIGTDSCRQAGPLLLWTFLRQCRVGILNNHGQGAALHRAGASAYTAAK